jgi:CheY-like chemotaxis protein/anti-sigma regulatory factor (Ser/Thr protein kinase)
MTSHLLVVDDSGVDRTLAGQLLAKNAEWTVAYACNGKEAVEQFEHHVPDLVITDLQMPEMNGLELVELVREQHPAVPVVLMTGFGSDEIAREAIEKGAASYVPKHDLATDLAETVGRLLTTARRQAIRNRLQNIDSDFECEFENDLQSLSAFTQELRQTIAERGLFHENECLRFATAVDEALMNAYFHGNLEIDSKLRELNGNDFHDLANQRRHEEPYRNRHISVHLRINPDQVAVTIHDEGPGFDQGKLPDPTDPEYMDRPYGRGILLMKTFADTVRYNETGNAVTLVKWTD